MLLCFFPKQESFCQQLTKAVINNDITKAKSLIENGAYVNEHSKTKCFPLRYAVKNGNKEMVELLLNNGAVCDTCPVKHTYNWSPPQFVDETNMYETPYCHAISLKNLDIVQLFSKYGLDVTSRINSPKFTYPVIYAIKQNSENIYRYFVDKGADVKVKDYSGNTTLMFAARLNNIELMEELLGKGCQINDTSLEGYTPLMFAVENEKIDGRIIDFLLSKGADINYVSYKSQSAYSIACYHNNRPLAMYLLEKGFQFKQANGDLEGVAIMNLFAGDFFINKGDYNIAKICYEKTKKYFESVIQIRTQRLDQLNSRLAGKLILQTLAYGIVAGAINASVPGQHVEAYNYPKMPYKYPKDDQNILSIDYQLPSDYYDEIEKVFVKNKIRQDEMFLSLTKGIIACLANGYTGKDLDECIQSVPLN